MRPELLTLAASRMGVDQSPASIRAKIINDGHTLHESRTGSRKKNEKHAATLSKKGPKGGTFVAYDDDPNGALCVVALRLCDATTQEIHLAWTGEEYKGK